MLSGSHDIAASSPDQTVNPGKEFDALTEPVAARRPTVSVMVITYNHAKYIAQALESVLMQETDFDFEINVVEDCSTDGTQEIIMRYVRQYPHIVKPFLNEKNIGFKVTQKNFYRGFHTLTGKYFAILEGDDYWTSPHKLQRQVDFLESNPDFAICAHNTLKVYEDSSEEPHRFLYLGHRSDSTVEDVIWLRSFFHTTGILYRNVFNGIPPRQYRSKWSCDIFIMISHAVFGKVHHIDEDMAVYRAHTDGRFSSMPPLDAWLFNIDGLRRYNAWLGYRFLTPFSGMISDYCQVVLKSHGKNGAAFLSTYQFVKIQTLSAFYGSIYRLLTLRKLFAQPTRLSGLPLLREPARWDLVWGLNVEAIESPSVVPDHPVLRLIAVCTNDPAVQNRHAISQCISGLTPGGTYRVLLWVKSTDGTNAQLQLLSVDAETGMPAHEGEARYRLMSSSVMTSSGLRSPGVRPLSAVWMAGRGPRPILRPTMAEFSSCLAW
jgi:glycosyltransferase involved in cell wall biosynthesis